MPDSIERTLILLVWSFGNDMKNYLWSKSIEDNRHKLVQEYIDPQSNKPIQLQYRKFKRNAIKCNIKQLQSIERLQQLERLQTADIRLSIDFIIGDYRDLKINQEDVVYCDPPYTNSQYNYGSFGNDKFYQWLAGLPTNRIFISEHSILPGTELLLDLGTKKCFKANTKFRNELLLKYSKGRVADYA